METSLLKLHLDRQQFTTFPSELDSRTQFRNETAEVREDFQQVWKELEKHMETVNCGDLIDNDIDVSDGLFQDTQTIPQVFSNFMQEGLIKNEPVDKFEQSLKSHGTKIFGKNVIGLHSINELKEDPEENGRVAHLTVQGRKIKVIIRPINRPTQQIINKKTLQDNILRTKDDVTLCKTIFDEEEEPHIKTDYKDEILSEMINGNYGTENFLDDTTDSLFQVLDLDSESVEECVITQPVPVKKRQESLLKKNNPQPPKSNLINILNEFEAFEDQIKQEIEVKTEIPNINEIKKDTKVSLKQSKRKAETRMHEAGVTINRNKLLQILSGKEIIQLDHDYCSSLRTGIKKEICFEKNPLKDSGLESGDVSDASEGLISSELHKVQPAYKVNAKLIEERRRAKNTVSVTKFAAAYFRAANAKCTDDVKSTQDTQTTTINSQKDKLNCDNSISTEERPKKKLKLEEYLSRRQQSKHCDVNKSNSSSLGVQKKKVEAIHKVKEEKPAAKGKECKEFTSRRQYRIKRVSSSSSSRSRSRSRSRHRDSRRRNKDNGRRRRYGSSSRSRSSNRSSSNSCSRRRRRSSPYRGRSSRSRDSYRRPGCRRYNNRSRRSRSRSPSYRSRSPQYRPHDSVQDKQRDIEERRVIYVGCLDEGTTSTHLRERFSVFGPIVHISLHFRDHGDNYGFVTYAYKDDAFDAIEHGNDDPSLPKYDLCFGGRRGFCRSKYSDLDGMPTSFSRLNDAPVKRNQPSFDALLKETQAKLKKWKS